MKLEDIADQFKRFGLYECLPASQLYHYLSLKVAEDPEIQALLLSSTKGQPLPNLLFAAVQYLLLENKSDPLINYYSSLVPHPENPQNAYPFFRKFCLEHSDQIQRIVSTRIVQTNEVRRCAVLLPAFNLVKESGNGLPLALVEIGSSAGFNLRWDKYRYEYGNGQNCGTGEAEVVISCEVKGEDIPAVPKVLPEIISRVGIDLNPIDVLEEDACKWLKALVWPEQSYRFSLLEKAIKYARQYPINLLRGNALDLLPATLTNLPIQATICIFHSFTLNQFSRDDRAELSKILSDHSTHQNIYRVSMEHQGPEVLLRLFSYIQGEEKEQILARTNGHATFLEWLAF